jgi:hypothetical protein
MQIALGIFIGAVLGVLLGYTLRTLLGRNAPYYGIINVDKVDGKTIYTLDVQLDPQELEFQESVVFKVERVESSDRT